MRYKTIISALQNLNATLSSFFTEKTLVLVLLLLVWLEHLQQSSNTTPPIKWYWGSPILLSRFIGGDVVAVPQYIFPNTHMKGRSHRSAIENIAENGSWDGPHGIGGVVSSPFFERR